MWPRQPRGSNVRGTISVLSDTFSVPSHRFPSGKETAVPMTRATQSLLEGVYGVHDHGVLKLLADEKE